MTEAMVPVYSGRVGRTAWPRTREGAQTSALGPGAPPVPTKGVPMTSDWKTYRITLAGPDGTALKEWECPVRLDIDGDLEESEDSDMPHPIDFIVELEKALNCDPVHKALHLAPNMRQLLLHSVTHLEFAIRNGRTEAEPLVREIHSLLQATE